MALVGKKFCMYICINACMYEIYIHMHTYMCYMHVCMFVRICVCSTVHMYNICKYVAMYVP